MKRLVLLFALGASACEREVPNNTAVRTPVASNVLLPGPDSTKKSASVVPLPKDQAQLDRMILAGYTPHGNHMHPPGVKECPLAQGSEGVM
ncbi:hypothetical protein [Sphingomonas sp.]|uniref:hypothetical protein n=1 Tax=Sphingomonas sp. TaxID=28214 RepID=UPI00286B320F|nr:hypothetical protein [Sphingomonas sp.]